MTFNLGIKYIMKREKLLLFLILLFIIPTLFSQVRNVVPTGDCTTDLGTTLKQWKMVYACSLSGDGSNITGLSVTSTDTAGYALKIPCDSVMSCILSNWEQICDSILICITDYWNCDSTLACIYTDPNFCDSINVCINWDTLGAYPDTSITNALNFWDCDSTLACMLVNFSTYFCDTVDSCIDWDGHLGAYLDTLDSIFGSPTNCLIIYVDSIYGCSPIYVDADSIVVHNLYSDSLSIRGVYLSSTDTGHTCGADLIGIPIIAGADNTTVHEFINLFGSAGRSTGGEVTDAGSETVNITAGTGFIKALDDDTSELLSFNWDAVNGAAITTDAIRYAIVSYNGGSPLASIVDSEDDWDLDTSWPLAKIVNEGGTLHILNNPWWVTDGITNIIERFQSEGSVVRDNRVGGLVLSVDGSRQVSVTAGVLWSRLVEFPFNTFSAGDTFELYWRSGASTWTDSNATVIPITLYNRLSDNTRQTITNNKYFNWWFYVEVDNDEVALVYPQVTYNTLAEAEAASPPSSIPTHISENGILIGRAIFKQGVATVQLVQSTFSTVFTASAAADHGNLSGLADDDHPQYLLVDSIAAYPDTTVTNALNYWDCDSALSCIGDTLGAYPDTTITNALNYYDCDSVFDCIGDTLGALVDSTVTNAIIDSLGAYPDTSVTNALNYWDCDSTLDCIGDTLGAYLDTTTSFSSVDSSTYCDTCNFSYRSDTTNMVELDPTPNADSTATGIITQMTYGETIVVGEVLYLKSDGELYKADADSTIYMPAICISLEDGSDGQTKNVLLQGFMRADDWNWTVGGLMFVSVTAGDMSQTAVSATYDQHQIVGIATHADRIYFNPNYMLIEIP